LFRSEGLSEHTKRKEYIDSTAHEAAFRGKGISVQESGDEKGDSLKTKGQSPNDQVPLEMKASVPR